MKDEEIKIREAIAPFSDVPVVFTSIPEKQRIFKLIEEAFKVYENRKQQVEEKKLNEVVQKAVEQVPHPLVRGRPVEFSHVEQVNKTSAPDFCFTNEFSE